MSAFVQPPLRIGTDDYSWPLAGSTLLVIYYPRVPLSKRSHDPVFAAYSIGDDCASELEDNHIDLETRPRRVIFTLVGDVDIPHRTDDMLSCFPYIFSGLTREDNQKFVAPDPVKRIIAMG